MYSRLVNDFSATQIGSWLVKHVASRIDPLIFRATGGRYTGTLIPTLPMLAMTCTGRKSGRPRTVQLAYLADGDDKIVVASAMGQERHPAWRYNLEANPDVEIQVRGERYRAHASVLPEAEKAHHWDDVHATIPQMQVYEQRTNRDIKLFRIRRMS